MIKDLNFLEYSLIVGDKFCFCRKRYIDAELNIVNKIVNEDVAERLYCNWVCCYYINKNNEIKEWSDSILGAWKPCQTNSQIITEFTDRSE